NSLNQLITACVRAEVARFNASRQDPLVLRFLTPADIGEGAAKGKVAFGEIANHQTVEVDKATAVAIEAWRDGLFAVFHGDTELLDLDTALDLKEGDHVTFLRLTFLTGTFW
ncbi:MAG: hypothetical protein AAF597_07870, partial [Bacteroidota bacterium]